MSEKPKDWGNINSYTGNREAESDKQVIVTQLQDLRDEEQRAFNAWQLRDKTETEYKEVSKRVGQNVLDLAKPVIATETSEEELNRLSADVANLFSPHSIVAKEVRALVIERIQNLKQKT